MILLIVAGILALGFGIWLGLPGDSHVSREEAEDALTNPYRIRKRVKKVFTPLDWIRARQGSQLRESEPDRFKMAKTKKRGR
ncbi:MAG: hypothetical protein R3E10_07815 [Gemmatimonadota bacterium]